MSEQHNSRLLYLNVALSVALIALIWMSLRGPGFFAAKEVAKAPAVKAAVAQAPEEAPVTYGIKREDVPAADGPPKSLAGVFDRYPKSDVGDSPAAAWSKVSPDEKAKLAEVVDKTIEDSKVKLANDPGNKKAKKLLFMSESLKKMMAKDFDYAFISGNAAANGSREKR